MRRTVRLATAVAVILGAMASPALADPQITDIANDANGLNDQQLDIGAGYGTSTDDASYGPADILSVEYETLFEETSVGGDGIDYRATGLAIHIATSAAPKADGPTLGYRIDTTLGGCDSFFNGFLRGQAAPADDPNRTVQWRQLTAAPTCPNGATTVSNAAWTAVPVGNSLVFTIPFASLTAVQARLFEEGDVFTGSRANVHTFISHPNVQVPPNPLFPAGTQSGKSALTAPNIDGTAIGLSFTIGEDMPTDVPCTANCPV